MLHKFSLNLSMKTFHLLASLIIFYTFLSYTNGIGFRGNTDTHNIFSDIEGDAPNSSICRGMFSNNTESEMRCSIARYFPGCQFDSGFLQYLVFQYCTFNDRIVPTIFMVFWLILLLGAFATISDSFFSTSLIALARTLRMSQNLAGVTLLAFGNGAPDVFSAVTAITTGDPDAPDEGLGLGFLLGSGLLVNTVTAGLVIFLKPFKMSRRPFLKDTLFYMVAVSWAASILIRRQIYITDAIGFLILYLCYVFTTWASSTYMRRQRSHGTKSILPLCLQRLLAKPLNYLNRNWDKFMQTCKQHCPKFSAIKKLRNKVHFNQFKLSTKANNNNNNKNHIITEDGVKISDRKSPERTIQSPILKVNGTVGTPIDKLKSINPNIHVSDKRMNKRHMIKTPKIEITSPSDEDKTNSYIDNDYNTKDFDNYDDARGVGHEGIKNTESPHFSPRLSDFSVGFLTPMDGVKKRASSMTSTEPITDSRRLSTEHSGLGRGRCRRTQSVIRRRPSTRMSAAGYELSYMVRWIIANRELEEKVLGSRDGDTRRSQKSSQYDQDESQNDQSTQRDLFSRKGSRPGSNLTNAGHLPSPTLSDFSVDDDTMPKSSVSLKRIKLNFQPSDLETGKQFATTGDNIVDKFGHQEGGFQDYENENEIRKLESGEEEDEDLTDEEEEEEVKDECSWLEKWAMQGVWHHFAYYMIPIDVESWHQQSIFSRFLQILQTPIFIIFRLTIPTVLEELADESEQDVYAQQPVDANQQISETTREIVTVLEGKELTFSTNPPESNHESEFDVNKQTETVEVNLEFMHGWCKPLNVFQCLLVPTLWPMLLTANGKCIGLLPIGQSPVPVFCPFLIGGFIIALVVFFTSKWNQPPKLYHRPFFATLGFVTSIIWIYALAHELVNSLETLGIVWEISEAILGLSVMALASSIGDIMANCLLARNGYPRIAYAACLGSPLFNLLLGAGLSYTIKISRAGVGHANLSFTLTQALLFSCLLVVLTLNILTALIGKFKFRRYYGIVLIIVYLIFVTTAILIEVDVIVSPVNWHLATGTE
uniref:Sodium/calcium exchanger membrane region domain-containing protein n=1 Tax=Trichobilharzia regenti TaxID=157069 RepID=A0AA85IVL5_TRIRE|nr:unnamed protein product [Trichobilharzia regenti]